MSVERTRAEVAEIISTFLRGGGGAWDWDDFISIRIRDPFLEAIRAQMRRLAEALSALVAGTLLWR